MVSARQYLAFLIPTTKNVTECTRIREKASEERATMELKEGEILVRELSKWWNASYISLIAHTHKSKHSMLSGGIARKHEACLCACMCVYCMCTCVCVRFTAKLWQTEDTVLL